LPLCLGTGNFGAALDQDAAFTLLDAFLDQGGNFLDSAQVYCDWIPDNERSSSEKIIGRWMKERGNRDRLVLATKGAHPDLATMHIPRMSRAAIEADLDASLRHLQTDVIDLYWLHRDDPARSVAEILATLNAAVQAGKIRAFGCSNWCADRLQAANEYAATHGLQGFVASQVLWNLAVVDSTALGDPTMVAMDAPLWDYHLQTGLAAIPFSATANGLFNKLEQGSFADLSPLHQQLYAAPENLRRFERAHRLAQEKGLSITQVVLGYLLSQPFPTYPVIGPRSVAQLRDSLSAAQVRLTASELDFLEGKRVMG
jgi:aryl-alcohol dehydrogenase-like predicted oxidoreductase